MNAIAKPTIFSVTNTGAPPREATLHADLTRPLTRRASEVNIFGKQVFSLRASSVPTLLDCPARWKAVHVERLFSPTCAEAKFGTALHAGVAKYDAARLYVGSGSKEESVDAFNDSLKVPEEGFAWVPAEYEKAQKHGIELLGKYIDQIAPGKRYAAIEQKCPDLDVLVEGVILRLTGTVDRIQVGENGGFGVCDFKSGEQAVKADGTVPTGKHAGQLAVYELLGSAVTGCHMQLPAEIIGLQTNGKTRIGIGKIENAAANFLGTDENPGNLVHIARLLRGGVFFGNPTSLMCSPKFCPAHGKCQFRA